MTQMIVTKVNADGLYNWLYDDGFDELIKRAAEACDSFPKIFDQDDQGKPTEKAGDAMRAIRDLENFLGVITIIRHQIAIGES